jgi:hypothetical protein
MTPFRGQEGRRDQIRGYCSNVPFETFRSESTDGLVYETLSQGFLRFD